MNKHFKIIVILLVFSGISFAQTKEELKAAAFNNAKAMTEATLQYDYETIFKHLHPSVVQFMGGKEKGIEFTKSTFDKMIAKGFEYEKAAIISVSDVVYENDEYRCIVESFVQIKYDNKRIKTEGYALGVYNAEEKLWSFIEGKQLKTPAMVNMILPNFKTELEIPDDVITTEDL